MHLLGKPGAALPLTCYLRTSVWFRGRSWQGSCTSNMTLRLLSFWGGRLPEQRCLAVRAVAQVAR